MCGCFCDAWGAAGDAAGDAGGGVGRMRGVGRDVFAVLRLFVLQRAGELSAFLGFARRAESDHRKFPIELLLYRAVRKLISHLSLAAAKTIIP